jgi:hypothetical protein
MLVSNGAALMLPSSAITPEIVANLLQQLVSEPRFTHNLRRLRALLQLAGGKEQAARWVWTIANHGSSMLMPKELSLGWFLYYELDILVARIVLGVLLLLLPYATFRLLTRCCSRCRRSQVLATTQKKEQ